MSELVGLPVTKKKVRRFILNAPPVPDSIIGNSLSHIYIYIYIYIAITYLCIYIYLYIMIMCIYKYMYYCSYIYIYIDNLIII
jgi:hypothetical protein